MIDISEQEIMKRWENTDEMGVSITVVAYNHEKFIHETLNSFLSQETSFPFEVIINDDASTDSTAKILKEYETKFPNIIKPVYQTENQFSQGINTMAIIYPYAKGKYVALCDGDDYWIDKHKLETQVKEMEAHPELDMSFHPTCELYKGKRRKTLSKHANGNKIFSTREVILGGGAFCPTASLLIRGELIARLPKWFITAIPGDYITQMIGSARGGALYIDKCMSVYRLGEEGSWTTALTVERSEARKAAFFSARERLNLMNKTLDKKYQKEMDHVLHLENLKFIKAMGVNVATRAEIFNRYKDSFSLKEKLLWHLVYKNPNLLYLLQKIKHAFN